MPIRYPEILDLRDEPRTFEWTEKDAMLYALAVGCGSDPQHEAELNFVLEDRLQVLPTFASVACWGAGVSPQQMGIDRRRALHGSETVILHAPLPPRGKVVSSGRVLGAWDKGDKGAIIEREITLADALTGQPLVSLRRTAIARSDGGFGGPTDAPQSLPTPDREPDALISLPTRPEQALIYRLCGDRNPLHADPDAARAAGFERPILHGLCTLGICCRAAFLAFPDLSVESVALVSARFSAPVTPGETVDIRFWRSAKSLDFEARVTQRRADVIRSGRMEFH